MFSWNSLTVRRGHAARQCDQGMGQLHCQVRVLLAMLLKVFYLHIRSSQHSPQQQPKKPGSNPKQKSNAARKAKINDKERIFSFSSIQFKLKIEEMARQAALELANDAAAAGDGVGYSIPFHSLTDLVAWHFSYVVFFSCYVA